MKNEGDPLLNALLDSIRHRDPKLFAQVVPHVEAVREIRHAWRVHQDAPGVGVFWAAGHLLAPPSEGAVAGLVLQHLEQIDRLTRRGRKNWRVPDGRPEACVREIEADLATLGPWAAGRRVDWPRVVRRLWRKLFHMRQREGELAHRHVPEGLALEVSAAGTPRAAALCIVGAALKMEPEALARQIRRYREWRRTQGDAPSPDV